MLSALEAGLSFAAAILRLDPQMPADKAQRNAHLQVVAGRRLQPKSLNAGFRHDLVGAVLALDRALRGNQPRRIRSEKIILPSVGAVQRQIDPIEAIRVRVHIQGLGIEMRIADFR